MTKPIRTKRDLRALLTRGRTTASVLPQPGFLRLGAAERQRIADTITQLCDVAERLLPDAPVPDVAPMVHDAAHADDDGHGDLFGVPA